MTQSIEKQLFDRIQKMTFEEFEEVLVVDYNVQGEAQKDDEIDAEDEDGKYTVYQITVELATHS